MRKSKAVITGSLALNTERNSDLSGPDKRVMCLSFLANAKANGFNDRKYALLPTTLLHIDMRYQREPDERHIKKIISNWDYNLCDDLLVSFRHNKDETGFYVVDGQHRLEAAKRKNIDMLPCVIFEGKSVEWEAKVYSEQGVLSKKPSSHDQFKSRAVWGNREVIIVQRICDEYRVQCCKNKESSLPLLKGVDITMRACAKHGEDGVRWIFSTIDKLGWHNDDKAYGRTVIGALSNVYGMHEDKIEAKLQILRFIDGRIHSPSEVIIKAKSENPGRSEPIALTKLFESYITVK